MNQHGSHTIVERAGFLCVRSRLQVIQQLLNLLDPARLDVNIHDDALKQHVSKRWYGQGMGMPQRANAPFFLACTGWTVQV